jgi:hypothetical protein
MQVDIVALGVSQEFRGSFNKRDGSRSVVAEEYIQESSATDDACQVFMRGTFGEISNQYSALIIEWYTVTWPSILIVIFVWWAVWVASEGLGFSIACDSMEQS